MSSRTVRKYSVGRNQVPEGSIQCVLPLAVARECECHPDSGVRKISSNFRSTCSSTMILPTKWGPICQGVDVKGASRGPKVVGVPEAARSTSVQRSTSMTVDW